MSSSSPEKCKPHALPNGVRNEHALKAQVDFISLICAVAGVHACLSKAGKLMVKNLNPKLGLETSPVVIGHAD